MVSPIFSEDKTQPECLSQDSVRKSCISSFESSVVWGGRGGVGGWGDRRMTHLFSSSCF